MLEAILAPVAVCVTKHMLNHFWPATKSEQKPIVNNTGNIDFIYETPGSTVINHQITVGASEPFGTLVGKFFITDSVQDLIDEDTIALVILIDTENGAFFLFEADTEQGYEIELPIGPYLACAFLVDGSAASPEEAEIYAVGLPSGIDLEEVGRITVRDLDDIFEVIDTSPRAIFEDDYTLDMIFLDTADYEELPQYLPDLF